MPSHSTHAALHRLDSIARARDLLLQGERSLELVGTLGIAPWIQRSWQRCLHNGQRPHQHVAFDSVSQASVRRTVEANHGLIAAATPVLRQLGHVMADTRYFALLTDAAGIVIATHGPIDLSDPRAHSIARVGVNLSEQSVGTSAIGAALQEQHAIWLHRGEHFFRDTSVYSCAGAPLFGPEGQCIGMLDLTGIEARERPELMHLVEQSAHTIENNLLLRQEYALLVRLNWSPQHLGQANDGLVCLDADGWVLGMNHAALQMVGGTAMRASVDNNAALHANDLFAVGLPMLFDAARAQRPFLEVPLWSGLRLHMQAQLQSSDSRGSYGALSGGAANERKALRDVEAALIQQAVRNARGNVAEAAKALGISRATVYRKLAPSQRGKAH